MGVCLEAVTVFVNLIMVESGCDGEVIGDVRCGQRWGSRRWHTAVLG